MNWILGVEQLLRLLVLAWRDLRRPALSLLLFGWVLIQAVFVFAAADPTHPFWGELLVPLFRWRFGEVFLHYPQSLIGLGTTAPALLLPFEWLMGSFVQLTASAGILMLVRGNVPNESAMMGTAFRRLLPMLLFGILIQLAWLVLYTLPLRWVLENGGLSHPMRLVAGYGGAILPLLALAPFFYTAPALLEGASLAKAMKESVARVASNKTIVALLIVLPWAAVIPTRWILDRSSLLANQLRPEVILVVVLFELILGSVASWLVWDATARLLVRGSHHAEVK